MKRLYINTPKEYIQKLPRAEYKGKAIVIISLEEARKAIRLLAQSNVLGFDTETRPSFTKGRINKVSLIQLCNEHFCFLFRINQIGIPIELTNLFSSKEILKVGISLKDDFQQIKRIQDFIPEGFVDLQSIAKSMGIKDMSLQKLYANICGERISKSAQLTNWDADILTSVQKSYASLDAYACLRLYHKMKSLQDTSNFFLIEKD